MVTDTATDKSVGARSREIVSLSEQLKCAIERAAERGLLQDVLAHAAEDFECSGFTDDLKVHGNIAIRGVVRKRFASLTISEGGAGTLDVSQR